MAESTTFLQLKSDMKDAMRAREADRLSVIRMLISSLKNKQIELREDLTEDHVLAVLTSEAKKRNESITEYTKGGRDDMAQKETEELELIQSYLPAPMSDDEVSALVDEIVASSGASSPQDMGKVMGPLMEKLGGRYDGKKAKDLVLKKLRQ